MKRPAAFFARVLVSCIVLLLIERAGRAYGLTTPQDWYLLGTFACIVMTLADAVARGLIEAYGECK